MANQTIIWRGMARQIEVTVTEDGDLSGWTLQWRIGTAEGSAAALQKSLTHSSGQLFIATLTAAESAALPLGAVIVFVVRTNAGSEDVLGNPAHYTVRDPVLAAA